MWLHRESPAGVRFFTSLKAGRGLKPSARAAGIGMEPALRWLQEAFVALRDEGLTVVEAQAALGFSSSRMPGWEQDRLEAGDGRHHLRREPAVEAVFWAVFDSGASVGAAARHAGVGRATAYRWWQQRFVTLRETGVSTRAAGRGATAPTRARLRGGRPSGAAPAPPRSGPRRRRNEQRPGRPTSMCGGWWSHGLDRRPRSGRSGTGS